MARRLTFGLKGRTKPFSTPAELDLWLPKGRKAPALIYVLSAYDFSLAAAKRGYGERHIGGFAVWGRWWRLDEIYLRNDRVSLFLHEWRHIEEQSDFHGERT